ncbi:MAG: 3-dehydroquinate synthase [Bacteroidales bacterium]
MYKQIKLLDHHIIAGQDSLSVFKTLFDSGDYQNRQFIILTDTNTQKHCLPLLSNYLPSGKTTPVITIPAGEHHKNLSTAQLIWSKLMEYHADRHSVLVNLGGGVISDIGGFVAATFKRGIASINIPTTLMGMIDAAIGAKTGINYQDVKNILGTFHQPDAVYLHDAFLHTLPQKDLESGYAEIIKYALINDPDLWSILKQNHLKNFDQLKDLIIFSVLIKSEIIEQDPYEKGKRKILNFGHTIGHALETLRHQKNAAVTHGHAVAAGIMAESYLSYRINNLGEESYKQIKETIKSQFPPIAFDEEDIEDLLLIMSHDKKNLGNKINFSLLEKAGQCNFDQLLPESLIKEALNAYRNEHNTNT